MAIESACSFSVKRFTSSAKTICVIELRLTAAAVFHPAFASSMRPDSSSVRRSSMSRRTFFRRSTICRPRFRFEDEPRIAASASSMVRNASFLSRSIDSRWNFFLFMMRPSISTMSVSFCMMMCRSMIAFLQRVCQCVDHLVKTVQHRRVGVRAALQRGEQLLLAQDVGFKAACSNSGPWCPGPASSCSRGR